MLTAVGLMSGTSLDGVDASVIETDGERIGRLGPSVTLPYAPALRARLRALLDRADGIDGTDAELVAAERALTEIHAKAVAALGTRADLIGFHGQTILHRPRQGRTWQIGDAALLADLTGCPVIHDFRSADVAAGGEGAPLAPLFHAAMLPARTARPACVLNIGGVANLTWVGDEIVAGDTGPGNALLDDWAMRHTGIACDVDGALARAGRADPAVLTELLAHPFFRRPPPKSLDRLEFHHMLPALAGLSAEDGAATLVALTVEAVALCPLPAVPAEWFVCGGGRRNPTLMDALAARLAGRLRPVEAIGWDGDALEAQCFGFLAARSERGLPLSLPGTTGVGRPTAGGKVSRGSAPNPAGVGDPRPA